MSNETPANNAIAEVVRGLAADRSRMVSELFDIDLVTDDDDKDRAKQIRKDIAQIDARIDKLLSLHLRPCADDVANQSMITHYIATRRLSPNSEKQRRAIMKMIECGRLGFTCNGYTCVILLDGEMATIHEILIAYDALNV